ncbi:MAG: pantetheine-phosphate adenylyltransferase [Lachnospiraceae bacterium]|jgi:pantetheine-phosphate adenylyltransferase|nr:pantetheine-phosphate adenylyltransferase [Lachnospiraceae bacterium]MBR3573983.1 pantetheine-phosphate adenylyltransferase [Lachnospiraceae bacterium]MCR5740625.1 pantetheine-phosphate adenylyltransferase [Lachnospiraceae bacterium]
MNRALYPGSFDPMTLGHLDIIRRASLMFDELIVAVLDNTQKTPLFSTDERVKILQEATKDMPNVKVDYFRGLTVDYCLQNNLHIMVRGLRAVTDFEYELQIAQTNRKISDNRVDTVFLTTDLQYSYLSSSTVKEIAKYGGDVSHSVTPYVEEALRAKYSK